MEKKKVGRPRSTKAKKAIFDAVWELLADNSVRDLALEQVASKAHVGKTTIYRWWKTKLDLFVDVFFDRAMLPNTEASWRSWFERDEAKIFLQMFAECQMQIGIPARLEEFIDRNLKKPEIKDLFLSAMLDLARE